MLRISLSAWSRLGQGIASSSIIQRRTDILVNSSLLCNCVGSSVLLLRIQLKLNSMWSGVYMANPATQTSL